jgi:hypothetical protein
LATGDALWKKVNALRERERGLENGIKQWVIFWQGKAKLLKTATIARRLGYG